MRYQHMGGCSHDGLMLPPLSHGAHGCRQLTSACANLVTVAHEGLLLQRVARGSQAAMCHRLLRPREGDVMRQTARDTGGAMRGLSDSLKRCSGFQITGL